MKTLSKFSLILFTIFIINLANCLPKEIIIIKPASDDTLITSGQDNSSLKMPLKISTRLINFDYVPVGEIKDTSITIQNTSQNTIHISSLAFFGNDELPSSFFMFDVFDSIASGQSVKIRFRYQPASESDMQCILKIYSNMKTDSVILTGRGYQKPGLTNQNSVNDQNDSLAGVDPIPPEHIDIYAQINPNPNHGTARIVLVPVDSVNNVEIKLFDNLGNQIKTIFTGTINSDYHQFDLDLNNCNSGSYFVKIIINKKEITLKTIKE